MKALITGAGSGLGRALALLLAGEGYCVHAIDRDLASLQELAAETPGIVPVCFDLSRVFGLEPLCAELAQEGPFDIVILNAGVNATGRFETIPAAVHENLIAVNTVAPMALTSALLRHRAFSSASNLIFVASLSVYVGYPGASSYAASKQALSVYAASIRRPLMRNGICVTTAYPGPLQTPHAARHSPLGQDGRNRMAPRDAARTILAGARAGRASIFPGLAASAAAFAGFMTPGVLTRLMRKALFEKLDREVW